MGNKKTIIGSAAAIVASVALIGGGTFAAWSDFQVVEDQAVGAGQLVIDVTPDDASFDVDPLAPDESVVRTFELSRDDSTVDGTLYVDITGLTSTEDGCSNTNSEELAEVDFAAHFATPRCTQVDNGAAGSPGGQLPDFAVLEVAYTDDYDDCTEADFTMTGTTKTVTILGGPHTFASDVDGSVAVVIRDQAAETAEPVAITVLDDDTEAVCAYVAVTMPLLSPDAEAEISLAQNAAMGDSAGFDLRFQIEQLVD